MSEGVVYMSLWRGEILVPARRSMARIIADVAERHRLPVKMMLTRSPARRFSWPRQEAAWELRQETKTDGSPKWSYPHIAARLNWEDHTTAMHAVRAHQARLDARAQEAA